MNIDFNDLIQGKEVFLFSGKEKGAATRERFNLDQLDASEETITVIIPESIEALTPSFVTGMFAPSVKKFGSLENFFSKYKFETSRRILQQIVNGAKSSLAKGNALFSMM